MNKQLFKTARRQRKLWNIASDSGSSPVEVVTANRPAWINSDDVTFTDSPMTISTGGTYVGLRISAPDGVNCVEITTDDLVIFRDCVFEHRDAEGIYAPGGAAAGYGSTPSVEVYNSVFLGRHPTTLGREIEKAIEVANSLRFIVENCHFQRGRVYAYQHSASPTSVLRVRYNTALNIDGREVDASGNPVSTNTQKQQFFQHNGRTAIEGDFEIAWNEIWNEPDDSAMEDAINLFSTGGTAANYVRIHHNLVNGAYPSNPASTSYAGGGIMLSDGPGDPAYGIADYNVVLASANYGMAITAGSFFTIDNNRVFRTGTWPDDVTDGQNNTGPGIYVYDYGSTTSFENHAVTNNVYRWQNYPSGTNNRWVEFPGTSFTDTGNTVYPSVINQSFIDAEVIAFRNGAADSGVTIGNSLVDTGPSTPSGTLIGASSTSTSLVDYPKTGQLFTGDWWVDPTSGTNGSGSAASPFNNLSSALAVVSDGERIIVTGGTLNITNRIYRSTNWTTGIQVVNYADERVVIDGSAMPEGERAQGLFLNGNREHWKGFHFKYCNGENGSVVIQGIHNKLEDVWVSHNSCWYFDGFDRSGGGIYVYAENTTDGSRGSYNTIQDCAVWRCGDTSAGGTNVHDNIVGTAAGDSFYGRNNNFVRTFVANGGDDGIDLYRNKFSNIVDCAAYKNGYWYTGAATSGDGNGIKAGGVPGSDNTVKGSVSVRNRTNGIAHNEGGSMTFTANTAAYNGSIGIDAGGDEAADDTFARNNLSLNNSTDVYVAGFADDEFNSWNLSVTNASFADQTSNDFSLDTGSAAIGVGQGGVNLGATDVALEILKEWAAKDLSAA